MISKNFQHETFFYENNRKRINDCLAKMAEMNLTYEKDGALGLRVLNMAMTRTVYYVRVMEHYLT